MQQFFQIGLERHTTAFGINILQNETILSNKEKGKYNIFSVVC